MERYANLAQTTLNGAINNSTTSVVVTSAALFPALGNFRIIIDSEIMLVTGVSGSTFTVTRAAESTVAASHSNGSTVTQVLTAGGLLQGILDNAVAAAGGYTLAVAPQGANLNTAITTTLLADYGAAIVMNVPTSMLLDKLGVQTNTGNTGICQWGLFTYADPTSCIKVAGGTGALSSTATYNTIAAVGAPVAINAGSYVLIFLMPNANRPTIYRTTAITGSPLEKFIAPYTWSDTPDLTTSWAFDNILLNVYLHGRLSVAKAW